MYVRPLSPHVAQHESGRANLILVRSADPKNDNVAMLGPPIFALDVIEGERRFVWAIRPIRPNHPVWNLKI